LGSVNLAAEPPFDFATDFEAQQERAGALGREQHVRPLAGALQQHFPESRRLGAHWHPAFEVDAIHSPGSPQALTV